MNLDSCFHRKPWIPVFTGMTERGLNGFFTRPSSLIKNIYPPVNCHLRYEIFLKSKKLKSPHPLLKK
jgi:hypothetical protein